MKTKTIYCYYRVDDDFMPGSYTTIPRDCFAAENGMCCIACGSFKECLACAAEQGRVAHAGAGGAVRGCGGFDLGAGVYDARGLCPVVLKSLTNVELFLLIAGELRLEIGGKSRWEMRRLSRIFPTRKSTSC